MFGVSFDFPVDETLQVIKDHVFVAFYLLVSEDDAQVHTSGVHLVLVFISVLSEQLKVVLQDVSRLLHIALSSFFVIEQTKLQSGLGLGLSAILALRDRQHLVEVLNSLRNVIILRVCFS